MVDGREIRWHWRARKDMVGLQKKGKSWDKIQKSEGLNDKPPKCRKFNRRRSRYLNFCCVTFSFFFIFLKYYYYLHFCLCHLVSHDWKKKIGGLQNDEYDDAVKGSKKKGRVVWAILSCLFFLLLENQQASLLSLFTSFLLLPLLLNVWNLGAHQKDIGASTVRPNKDWTTAWAMTKKKTNRMLLVLLLFGWLFWALLWIDCHWEVKNSPSSCFLLTIKEWQDNTTLSLSLSGSLIFSLGLWWGDGRMEQSFWLNFVGYLSLWTTTSG